MARKTKKTKLSRIEEKTFQDWRSTLPKNLQADNDSFDLRGAWKGGLEPVFVNGEWHLGSRNPRTGKILKSPTHPTYMMAIETDIKMGGTPSIDLLTGEVFTDRVKDTGGKIKNDMARKKKNKKKVTNPYFTGGLLDIGLDLAKGLFTPDDKIDVNTRVAKNNMMRGMDQGGLVPVNLESGESVETPAGQQQDITGNSHENGGEDMMLPEGTKVYSKRLKGPDGKSMADRKKERDKRLEKAMEMFFEDPLDVINKSTVERVIQNSALQDKADIEVMEMAKQVEDYGNPELLAEEAKYGGKIKYTTGGKVGMKIKKLIKEGKPKRQAIAIALEMERRQTGGILDTDATKKRQSNTGNVALDMLFNTDNTLTPYNPTFDGSTDGTPMPETFDPPQQQNLGEATPYNPAVPNINVDNLTPFNDDFGITPPQGEPTFYQGQGDAVPTIDPNYLNSLNFLYGDEAEVPEIDPNYLNNLRYYDETTSETQDPPQASVDGADSSFGVMQDDMNPAPEDEDKKKKDKLSFAEKFGTGVSMFGPLATTLLNRAGDKPNQNFFEGFGTDAINANMEAMKNIQAQKAAQIKQNQMAFQASMNRNRNQSRSLNTMNSLNIASDIVKNKSNNQATLSAMDQLSRLFSQRSGLLNERDKQVLTGRQQADIANRKDRDQFFTNLSKNVSNIGTGLQEVARRKNQRTADKLARAEAIIDKILSFS